MDAKLNVAGHEIRIVYTTAKIDGEASFPFGSNGNSETFITMTIMTMNTI